MLVATDIRSGNVLNIEGKPCKVISFELRGTGKFGKMVHLKLRNFEDGANLEKSFRAEDKVEDLEVQHARMQYLYREGEQLVFMNMESYEQFNLPAKSVGPKTVLLKENDEIAIEFINGRPLNIVFPKAVEVKVVSAPQPLKSGSDTNYKEVELENGLKILVPQFIKEGEIVRVNVEDFSYVERVSFKSH